MPDELDDHGDPSPIGAQPPRGGDEPSPGGDAAPDELAAIGALGEPTRRSLYEYVTREGGWVSRDQAAEALGLERGTVTHHLERLATDGLLDIHFKRLSGRRGPGAGRPAKLYRRANRELAVSLPPRDYELAGHLLAAAVERARAGSVDVDTALDEVARAEGRRIAEELLEATPPSIPSPVGARRAAALAVLAEHGYEPRSEADGTVVLGNCPFHLLAREHTELICGLNLGVLDAALAGIGDTGLVAQLDPAEGRCCVTLVPSQPLGTPSSTHG
jgi:predicted ArsR family transcriptional regulator